MDLKSILLTLGVMVVVTVAQESPESTQKTFVTPLTSMVVTKPEEVGQPKEKTESGLTDVDDFALEPPLPSLAHRREGRRRTRSGNNKGNRKRKGNRRKNGREKKRRRLIPSNFAPKFVLATIILEDVTGTVCAVPKRWQSGSYSILGKKSKGNAGTAPVILEVAEVSVGKRRLNDLLSLHMADGTAMSLGLVSRSPYYVTSPWVVQPNLDLEHTIDMSTYKVEFRYESKYPSVTVEIVKTTRRLYFFSVTLSGSGRKGLSFKKAVRPNANKRVKKWCNFKNGNYSKMGFVTGRKARKFLLN